MKFRFLDLETIEFNKAWQIQQDVFGEVKAGKIDAGLIFCRHYPVITLGRMAQRKNILLPEDQLESLGISLYEVGRGGDVTYHGPGQITAYPVFNLKFFQKDVHLFLRQLEDVVIDLAQGLGIKTQKHPGLTGVWAGQQKLASIGVAIKNWITFHGLSINVLKDDLANFAFIRPCGMDIKMTSLETLSNRLVDCRNIKDNLRKSFGRIFGLSEN